ncbi:hypothetical protein HNW77_14125 [Komagataeibacter sp. AV436]|uniref:Uncharacterized protein n=1 Tax=Komagataeibacter melomenusus TaxID=2766578 RepID=A0ABX2AGP4_9PROT|nr:hypothetical protein [Komagataeibacter melomenusus]MBV1829625.1 hypothetical protein [Komagataeibacter melomenusus]NPC67498.1 hypothetical protein [Komagataeibacter melomenusus]
MMSVAFGYDYDEHNRLYNAWNMTHASDRGRDSLECTGTLPPASQAIIAVARAGAGLNADVDMFFDVPASVIQSLTGFRYDQPVYDGREILFTRLRSLATA